MGFAHKGEQLDACADDLERAILCMQWEREQRDKFYIGAAKAEQSMGPDGALQFKRSYTGKSLADMEAMYCRWASMYLSAFNAKMNAVKDPEARGRAALL